MAHLKIKKADGSWDIIGGNPVELDDTLTQSDFAADAKAVGDAIIEVKNSTVSYAEIQDLTENEKIQARSNLGVYAQDDEPADAEVGTLWIDTDEEGEEGGNSTSITLDTTLTQEGMAADAKAVGDAIKNIDVEVDTTLSQLGKAADAKAVGDGLRNKPGLSVSNKVIDNYYDIEEGEIISYTGGEYAEVFNAYDVTDLADIPVILNRASGGYSHAEGGATTASGGYSHAEGFVTTASGDLSHAEGGATTASGGYSHAEGFVTTASGNYSHVQGKYNLKDVNNLYAHIVGNGNGGSGAQSFSNAHTLDWEGNAWYSGDVYVGSTSGTNKDEGSKKLATEEYVDEKIGNIEALLAAI